MAIDLILNELNAEIDRLRAENAKLREALELILKKINSGVLVRPNMDCPQELADEIEKVLRSS